MRAEHKRLEDELKNHTEHLEELVKERTRKLRETQEQLIISEQMATIGRTAAMVGHDLRNPLQGIINHVPIAREKLKALPEDSGNKASQNLDAIA